MGSSANRQASWKSAKKRRERLRAEGLRPIEIWVPDVRSPHFVAEAHRQSLAVASSVHAAEDQAFLDSTSALSDNETCEP
jgi:hypothetical protein